MEEGKISWMELNRGFEVGWKTIQSPAKKLISVDFLISNSRRKVAERLSSLEAGEAKSKVTIFVRC